jgi:transmembrane sensor
MDSMHDAVREEAAAWFARRRDGACTQSEEAAFEDWCERSEAHAVAYAETEHAWDQWKRLQSSDRMREMTAVVMAATAPQRRNVPAGRHWGPLLAAACIVAAVAVGGIGLLPRLLSTPPVTYSTALGEQRTEQLPDGTRVTLNTETALQVRYGHGRREVVLQHGEAMFDVIHDTARPFVVTAGDGSVTDLGTRFAIRGDSGTAIVTLLQGRVEIAARDVRKQLTPGEQARYGARIPGISVRRVDPTAVTAWLRGRLDFNGMPLAQAIADANRYSAVKLRLGDPKLADMPVGGSFRAGDNAAIAAALSAVFPVRVARNDAHEIVLMPR